MNATGLSVILLCFIMPAFADVPDTQSFQLGGKVYQLEVAKSYRQRLKGLMFRQHLPSDQGMIFLFPRSNKHNIWMKNTLIPLTVIWLDSNFLVIGVKKLKPCKRDPCQSYGINKPSRYIVELAESESGVKIGDLLRPLSLESY